MWNLKWERAQRLLSGLSRGRKLALGAIVTMMVVSVVWLSQQVSSSRGRMEPVLDQVFADADLLIIGDHLREQKIPHELHDGRVYVSAERKMDVLSELIYANVVTGRTEDGFDAMIRQTSVFDTPSKTDKMFNRAKEITLARVIGGFRGVRRATVLIDPTNERHIGGEITPSALVDIQTREKAGATPRELASAAVNVVTGAVSTMDRPKVRVTIDGASYNAGPDDITADVMERRQQCEQAHVAKVRQLLSYSPEVLVCVSVDLNVRSVEQEKRIVDPDNYSHVGNRLEMRSDKSEDPSGFGVIANAVPPIAEKLAGRGEGVASEYPLLPGETLQKTRIPAGKETVLSASVAVPRSYLVQLYQRSAREAAKDPNDALLQPIADAQLTRVRKLVRNSLGLKNDADVTVEIYEDTPTLAQATPMVASADTTIIPSIKTLKAHTKEISYAAAGVVGLVALSMMFRRGGYAAGGGFAIEEAAARVVPARVRTAPAVVHRDVQEDDETSDLLRQVRELASRQPDDASRVLREWIYKD
jgi:flagellar biosynthesis/type III secretory pathway M-ring protein FliF/YscJ